MEYARLLRRLVKDSIRACLAMPLREGIQLASLFFPFISCNLFLQLDIPLL